VDVVGVEEGLEVALVGVLLVGLLVPAAAALVEVALVELEHALEELAVDLLDVAEEAVVLAVDVEAGVVGAGRGDADVAEDRHRQAVAEEAAVVLGGVEQDLLEAAEAALLVVLVERDLALHLLLARP